MGEWTRPASHDRPSAVQSGPARRGRHEARRDRPAGDHGRDLRGGAGVRASISVAVVREGVRGSRDGRRPCRLVRGHRLVPPPARPADPAHRDHPAQQGPHRRGAGELHQGEFPDPVGRRPADAEHRRCRRDRAVPADPGRRRHAHPRRRVAPDRRHLRKPGRRAAGRDRQGRGFDAHPQDGSLAPARPRARLGDQRGPARADARGGDPLDGARARRERAADPRDGAQEGELGAQARRSRRQARRRDHRRPAQTDGRNVDRPRAPGSGQGRGSAGPARQRSADPARNPRAGRGDQGCSCSTTSRSACGSTRSGRRAARRSSAPRATPTRPSPASWAKS